MQAQLPGDPKFNCRTSGYLPTTIIATQSPPFSPPVSMAPISSATAASIANQAQAEAVLNQYRLHDDKFHIPIAKLDRVNNNRDIDEGNLERLRTSMAVRLRTEEFPCQVVCSSKAGLKTVEEAREVFARLVRENQQATENRDPTWIFDSFNVSIKLWVLSSGQSPFRVDR